ncbi:unnamed protein product [Blepharisma stoltei]|uniref:UBZ4-type domain-containing protein n=1 Tax=Blepharisma stoltei TaxID=1481888 RepID=A0AAU9J5P0_9CILI|nr:unnamed protein product [Blepharisma stoltei]
MFKRSNSFTPSRGNMLNTLPKPPNRTRHRSKISNFSKESQLNIEQGKIISKEQGEIEFGITCINCQEIVPENLIESHSKYCTTISEEVFKVDGSTEIEQFEFRIKKMINFLKDKELQSNYRPTEKNIISVLQKVCKNLLSSNKTASKELNIEVRKYIEAMLEKFKASLSLRIYAERLLLLCKEQLAVLYRIDQKPSEIKMKEEIENREGVYTKKTDIKEKLIIRTNTNKIVSDSEKIANVNSDISSSQTFNSGFSSISDIKESDLCMIENLNDLESNLSSFNYSQEELQKYFYSKCLELKLKYSSKKMVKLIPVAKLYSKVIENNMPAQEWAEFIEEELKNPEKWVVKEKKRCQKSKLRNDQKSQQFESIIEEDL